MSQRLGGKVAIVTGAASGFGAGIARLFAEHGAAVVLADVNGDGAKAVAAEIVRDGGEARPEVVDVTSREDLDAVVRRTTDEHGRLDVMVNNAGIPMRPTPLEDVDDATYERLASINMYGVFAGCRAAIPAMKQQGAGVILNMASTAAIRPRPGLSVYNATKAFVLNLTKTLALELAPHGIRVVSIAPTYILTPLTEPFFEDAAFRREVTGAIALGRLGEPDEVAAAVLFAASPQASLLTGTSLVVDGGYTAA